MKLKLLDKLKDQIADHAFKVAEKVVEQDAKLQASKPEIAKKVEAAITDALRPFFT